MAKKQATRRSQSGAVGGPSTGAGLNYQVDFAVLQALDRISVALVDPWELSEISMEPRITAGERVTCWDVRTSPPILFTEAKLRPKREEIVEWLDRIEAGAAQDPECTFELFYGRGAVSVLSAVERVCRIAKEAAGNSEAFAKLVEAERTTDVDIVLKHLKTESHRLLLRVRLVPFDPTSLRREINRCLRFLSHESDHQALYDFLFSIFHRGITERLTFKVRELMDRAIARGIQLHAPQTFGPLNLNPTVAGTVYILQECERGLPGEVIAAGLSCAKDDLEATLEPYVGPGRLFRDGDGWALARSKQHIVHSNGAALLERALRQLLQFIRDNRKTALGWSQIPNAIALAKACQTDCPELVSSLLWRLNTLLKRTGNKRLVLEVANLSLAAARRSPRTEEQTKAEAVALVCGRSWVFQRTNRLEDARADGMKSLRLGKEFDWDRNTAFCLKCIGRLFRIEAEQTRNDTDKFRSLLESSIEYLTQAIELFPSVTELSSDDRGAEVGDCYSLLGRTFLVAGDLGRAGDAARKAIERVTDKTSKDFADLQILLGDLAQARGDRAAARSHYDEAIRDTVVEDAEKSEIAARAWFQMGSLTSASHYFERAAAIWKNLDELENADNSTWQAMLCGKRVPTSAVAVLRDEPASVRIEALRQYEAKLAALTGPHRGRRSEPDRNYWKNLIPDARKAVAVRHIEW